MNLTPQDIERFWSKVNKTETCWIWQGATVQIFGNKDRPVFCKTTTYKHATRIAYELCIGRIPFPARVLQTCGNRLCVRPEHLVAASAGHPLNKYGNHKPAAERLRARVKITSNGCWEWLGWKNKGGYGEISIYGKSVQTHRASWELKNGPIPPGKIIRHKCDNRACINPDHLLLGTAQENSDDARIRNRLHPKIGNLNANHKLTDENVKEIREVASNASNEATYTSLAIKFHVSKATIQKVVLKITWKHLL